MSAGTRFQRYSCIHGFGHAFMRIHADRLEPALELCRALGPAAAPDCAQGAYHDYWFAVVGADDAKLPDEAVTDPRALCAATAGAVRAAVLVPGVHRQPAGGPRGRFAGRLRRPVPGLDGLQRAACMTAASVIGPPDPAAQLQLCAGLGDPADAASCIRGTKVQNLLGYPTAAYVDLIARCGLFHGATRAAAIAGSARRSPSSPTAISREPAARSSRPARPRRQCQAGARSMDEALVTFS